MASLDELPTLLDRLNIKKFSREDATAAVKGERIPDALGLPLLRLCTIRGIRYHDGFGHELRGVTDEFTRALNARAIMSNRVPEIKDEQEIPYCIWHPEVATEETYRRVVQKYKNMRYQVARACAVAGYTKLYEELDVLPEVHVAEEAREAGNMEIYDLIMAQPVKFKVMNDYDRSITSEPKEAHLNGDTAVRAMLEVKQEFRSATVPPAEDDDDDFHFDLFQDDGYHEDIFNITEDYNIDITYDLHERFERLRNDAGKTELLIRLLTSPLPLDLPTVYKDLLICVAAYYGDIDRYDRLRRPRMVDGELECCVRGIYHNSMFAVWWSKQQLPDGVSHQLCRAICARFIMNNVLSKVDPQDYWQPYLIWYPTIACETTYRKLAQLVPKAAPQVVRACIVAGYVDLFDELVDKVTPDDGLLNEAAESSNSHFGERLARRVEEVGKKELILYDEWQLQTKLGKQYSDSVICRSVGLATLDTAYHSFYNGKGCSASALELLACLPAEWRIPEQDQENRRDLDYEQWPKEIRGAEEKRAE